MRHHDIAVLIALLRDDAVLDHRNRRSLLGSKSDGDDGESHLPRALRLPEHFIRIVESSTIAHQDDRFVTLGLVEREQIGCLAQRTRQRAPALAYNRRVEILEIEIERALIDS